MRPHTIQRCSFVLSALTAHVAAQQFANGVSVLPNSCPGTVILADLDGDGIQDVLRNIDVLCYGQPTLFLQRRQAAGRAFVAGPVLPVHSSQYVTGSRVGDVDGDGDLDVVTSTFTPLDPQVAAMPSVLHRNQGGGTFVAEAASSFASQALSLRLADLQPDGDLDLVLQVYVPADDSDRLQFRLGLTGQAHEFGTGPNLRYPRNALAGFELCDVDGDGALDVFVRVAGPGFSAAPDQLHMHVGVDSRGWPIYAEQSAVRLPPFATSGSPVSSGDVDGDGDVDLVIADGVAGRLYLNDGSGRFTDVTATHMVPRTDFYGGTLADLDGDSDLDLLVTTSAGVVFDRNLGAGVFAADASLGVERLAGLGDIDDDGDLDVVATSPSGEWLWLKNRHRHFEALDTAQIGQVYRLRTWVRPGYTLPNTIAAPMIGAALTLAPISFPPFGIVHVEPNGAFTLPALPIPIASGFVDHSIAIPLSPSLIGSVFASQGIVADPSGVYLTDYGSEFTIR